MIAASQWYLYDAVHRQAERFSYYLATCAYLCGVLAPAAIWLGRRRPIDSRTWTCSLPIHLAAGLLLTAFGVFIEASIGWLPHAGQWSYWAALRHYFTQHTQISIVTYWALLGGFHIYRVYDHARRRQVHAAHLEAQLREAQLMALRSQLQPHFLFNTLQAATMLIYDDPQGAEEVLLCLSELLRMSLQILQRQEITLSREIDFVRHYALIQQRRFGDRLRFEFKVPPDLGECAVPSLILQPLVENAIQHGVGKYREPDVISIQAIDDKGQLTLEVRNLTSALGEEMDWLVSRGLGLSNTRARLIELYGVQHSFEVRNLKARGVVARLSIPLRLILERAGELVGEAVK